MWRSFPYSRRSFVQNAVFIGAVLPVTLAILVMVDADLAYISIIVALEVLAFVVMGISPLLTAHELCDDALVLRQGWYFRSRVPLNEISSANAVERGPARTGVFFRLTSSTLYVTSRHTDLIELRLKRKRPFGLALGKRADRVVFDVEDTASMLRALQR